MKSADGRDAENVLFGSTLSNDRHGGTGFDYLIANPPYGKDWKRDHDAVRAEHDRGAAGRFGPGLPRISDGQLLFLQHMLAHVKEPARGGSGLVGYEMNFNWYFYEYRPPRPLEEIEADIQQVEKEIVAMLREMAG